MPTDSSSSDDQRLDEALALLDHRLSAKRRSGAKRLRKLADVRAGSRLLVALKRELQDVRTWETQYQLVMAVGECGYKPALPYVESLVDKHFDATMVFVAVGDALVRLSLPLDDNADVVARLVEHGNPDLADGAIRAMAMLRAVPSRAAIDKLITYAEQWPVDERATGNRRFWVAAAAPGWLDQSPRVRPFLESCLGSENTGLDQAASKALMGRYSTWRPL